MVLRQTAIVRREVSADLGRRFYSAASPLA
jgi:hypothetical protein